MTLVTSVTAIAIAIAIKTTPVGMSNRTPVAAWTARMGFAAAGCSVVFGPYPKTCIILMKALTTAVITGRVPDHVSNNAENGDHYNGFQKTSPSKSAQIYV